MNAGKRRRVIQLDDNNETTVLAREGKVVSVGSSSVIKAKPAGLFALGEYSDSDSNNSDIEESDANENNADESVSTTNVQTDVKVENEVATFFSEVNCMSASNSPSREGSATPPVIQQSSKNLEIKKSNLYKSMFVKGATEWNKTKTEDDVSESTSSEFNEFPDEPTTLWQICVDENTQFQYYWHTISNEVTWTIPSDYTQYLLQYKVYEEQLAKIPEARREYLKKKKLGLISSPIEKKPLSQPNPPKHAYNQRQPSPVNVTNNVVIGQQSTEIKNDDEKQKKALTDPEKQFYSEIEELEKMDIELPEEKGELLEELPPLPEGPPPLAEPVITPNGSNNCEADVKGDMLIEEKKEESDVNLDIDDIDSALEKALEKKKEELKKLEAEESHLEEVAHNQHKHRHKHKRSSSPDSSMQMTHQSKKRKELPVEEILLPPLEKPSKHAIEAVRKVLVDYECDNSDIEHSILPNRKCLLSDVEDMSDVEEMKEVLESKLEFLSTSKKGLTRLQIMLIELQTRYSDYLNGALKKVYFHKKLSRLEKQIYDYEKNAVTDGWTCQWDRNFRRYFYTNTVTGDTQWEHPDASVQVVGETRLHKRHSSPSQSKSKSSKSHSSKKSKDKRREDKKSSKSKSSRRLERERDFSESHEVSRKSSKSHHKLDLESIVENISLGGLLSKNREVKLDSITIEDDEHDATLHPSAPEDPPPPSSLEPPEPENQHPILTAYEIATSPEEEAESTNCMDISDTKAEFPKSSVVIAKPTHYNNSEVSTSSGVHQYGASCSSASSIVSSSTLGTPAPPPPPPLSQPESGEPDEEPTVSSSEIKTDKKKKKDKQMANTNFALKKKKVSSLVNKWKKVKIEVEKEEKIDEERQLAIRQKLEVWKKDQAH